MPLEGPLGGMILKWILYEQDGKDVGWIHLAPDKDKWHALVKKVNKTQSSIKCYEFLDYLRN